MLPRACAIIPCWWGNPAPEAANISTSWVCVSWSAVSNSATLCPSPPGSSVPGIQARILEWAAISFSRESSWTQGSNPGLLHCRQSFYHLSHQESKFSTFYKYLFFIFVNKPLINVFSLYMLHWKAFNNFRLWRQKEKGMTEEKMVGWHHWLNEHEFEQTPGDSEGQGSLVCCSPWCCKKSDMT